MTELFCSGNFSFWHHRHSFEIETNHSSRSWSPPPETNRIKLADEMDFVYQLATFHRSLHFTELVIFHSHKEKCHTLHSKLVFLLYLRIMEIVPRNTFFRFDLIWFFHENRQRRLHFVFFFCRSSFWVNSSAQIDDVEFGDDVYSFSLLCCCYNFRNSLPSTSCVCIH